MAKRKNKHKHAPTRNYITRLQQKQLIKEALQDRALTARNEITVQRALWIAQIAMAEAFGIGTKRYRRDYIPAFSRTVQKFNDWADADIEYADVKLSQLATRLAGEEVTIDLVQTVSGTQKTIKEIQQGEDENETK